jgi:hypothetical protein
VWRPTVARHTSQPGARRPPKRAWGMVAAGVAVCSALGLGWLATHHVRGSEAQRSPQLPALPTSPDDSSNVPAAAGPLPSVEPMAGAAQLATPDGGAGEAPLQRPSASPPTRAGERARRPAARSHGPGQLDEQLETEWK